MHLFTLLFLGMLLLSVAIELWLLQRQLGHVAARRNEVPDAFAERISLSAHQRAADYTLSKARLARYEILYGALILLGLTLGGGLQWFDQLWRSLQLTPLLGGTGFILSVVLVTSLLDLPFALYRTFRIEQRFGFNRTTLKLFFSDMLKQGLLMLLLGVPLIALVLWLMQSAGQWWWLYVWLVWSGFTLLMLWAYPAVIAPLFNKFKPLEDEQLRQRINALLQRCGFTSNGIFVMDGSRRSSHGNAYFSGLGSNKRIVFFDTLLESLNDDEIEAVLAHELGHFRRKHIRKRLVLMMLMSLAGLALLGWLVQQPWFFNGLGINEPSMHAALVLFLLVMPVFTFFVGPLMALSSRKHEFEADDFAAEHADARQLIAALVKLYEENASTLTPDPLYSSFHDSHPPAPVRVAHLSSRMETV
ncbi:MAG: M48 family metallopeptidase [Gammaproteobacteria bacterium]|nr:M48 family metallopeptidase [Gammaproteobacteria bacterium]MCW8928228.1 M48 family metallopeptidase [Gammaproteobacteria bacterium]MCW8957438.1 M48 family metallopeptidase [Gammaproteobacteria bacterium]MCW8993694.1 M48 family metallopeptidase [Gammaproteobacteria bacterium]